MSAPITTSAPPRPAPPVTSGSRRRRWPVLVALAAAGWLVAGLAQWLRVDWVLLIITVVALAGLLRGGRGPVARVVLAVALLYSATCVVGLLFSVWPWHLAPVPVAGLGFTVLALGYGISGRRFAIPRPGSSDVATLAGAVTVAVVALWPLVQRGPGRRLAMFMHVEDFLRHMLMYDGIRESGGYMFVNQTTALHVTGGIGYFTYPTGSHFVFALTENFLRSGTAAGSATAWAGDYVWLFAASYIWLGLSVLWGVRHVAGPGATGWRSVPVTALVTVLLAFGPPIRVFDRGYPQETTALALVAVLVALCARPLARTRDQVVLVGALLAGISFSYYLFLPVALAFTVGWLVAHRRRLLRHWLVVVLTTLASIAGMAVIPGLNWKYAPPGAVLLQQGQVAPVPVVAWLPMVVFAAAAVIAQIIRGRQAARLVTWADGVPRIPTQAPRADGAGHTPAPLPRGLTRSSWRWLTGLSVGWVGLLGLSASVFLVLAVAAYQQAKGGADYFDVKLKHQLMIVCLVLFGGLTLLLGRLAGWAKQRYPALSRPMASPALAAGLVVVLALGVVVAPRGAAPARRTPGGSPPSARRRGSTPTGRTRPTHAQTGQSPYCSSTTRGPPT